MLSFRIKECIARWEIENRKTLSLEELAEFSGVTKQVLAKMSDPRGYVTVSRHIEELCHFFKIEPNDFIVFDCAIGTPRELRPGAREPSIEGPDAGN